MRIATLSLVLALFAGFSVSLVGQDAVHGRIEKVGDLRVVRLWGTAVERGEAHGKLLGPEIADLARKEFTARFSGRRGALKLKAMRRTIDRLILYPDDVLAEIEAVFEGVKASGADLKLPFADRDLDLKDLLLVNALDAVGVACSGLTVWGEDVDGGGVLTGRNFDWPLTGPHLLDSCVLIVQHPTEGPAWAAVAWPGYVGAVTAINDKGVAAFLHVGNGAIALAPRPESWPTAVAARAILGLDPGADGFGEKAVELLGNTSPPASYITRIVQPDAGLKSPALVFEANAKEVWLASKAANGFCVVTNHFQGRAGGRGVFPDSEKRWQALRQGVQKRLDGGDERVSVSEAWDVLNGVAVGYRTFGTLHSLVFRAEPWVFELRVAALDPKGSMVPATRSERRHELTREQVFPAARPR